MTRFLVAALAAALLAAPLQAQTIKTATTGTPAVKSIEAISFGPGGLLLIGDGKAAQVLAIDTGDTTAKAWSKTEVTGIKDQLAGALGTEAKNIEIIKMAVNPASKTAYIAVRALNSKKDLILTIDGAGKVREFSLENVKYARTILPPGEKSKVTKITDIAWAGDRVLVAAQASDTFASKVFTIPAPLVHDGKGAAFSTETYHVAHRQWETRAPLAVLIPYEEAGKKFVVGAFTCTPIVKYALDDMAPDAKVKGISVIELGSGNTPRDMFTYAKNGKHYILMNQIRFFHKQAPVGPSPYWTAKVELDVLKESELVNEKALFRTGAPRAPQGKTSDRAQVVADFSGVVHMDKLDDGHAVVIRTDDKGGFDLRVLTLP